MAGLHVEALEETPQVIFRGAPGTAPKPQDAGHGCRMAILREPRRKRGWGVSSWVRPISRAAHARQFPGEYGPQPHRFFIRPLSAGPPRPGGPVVTCRLSWSWPPPRRQTLKTAAAGRARLIPALAVGGGYAAYRTGDAGQGHRARGAAPCRGACAPRAFRSAGPADKGLAGGGATGGRTQARCTAVPARNLGILCTGVAAVTGVTAAAALLAAAALDSREEPEEVTPSAGRQEQVAKTDGSAGGAGSCPGSSS